MTELQSIVFKYIKRKVGEDISTRTIVQEQLELFKENK